jgi:integrase
MASQIQGMTVGEDKTITWAPKSELYLPAQKTKTRKAPWIRVSMRLRAILEMRRFDPKGEPHQLDRYVFGNEVGERIGSIKKGWTSACKRAGIKDFHFHDLRREAGSPWLEGGVPLHEVQRLLGHANISQTSTYLASTASSTHDALARYDRLQQLATEVGNQSLTGPPTATNDHERSNKTTTGGDLPIM